MLCSRNVNKKQDILSCHVNIITYSSLKLYKWFDY